MEIITDIEKLGVRADEVDVKKENGSVREIVLALKKEIRERNLTGLSAPQIGFDKRVFVINYNGDLRSYVNPIISEFNDLTLVREKCSSIPDKTFLIPRFGKIKVMYQTPIGKIESCNLVGVAASKFQHLMDHIDGMLVCDIGVEVGEDFDKASDEEKEEFIKAYIDSLDIKQKSIKKEFEEDKDLRQQEKAIEFVEKLNKGEIQFEGAENEENGKKNKNKTSKRK